MLNVNSCLSAHWFCLHKQKALQATNDAFHSPGLTPKYYFKSWLHLVCDSNTVGRRKVEMEPGKGIKVRDAAMPQCHCCVVTDELPRGQPGWCIRVRMKKEQARSSNVRQLLAHFSSLPSLTLFSYTSVLLKEECNSCSPRCMIKG